MLHDFPKSLFLTGIVILLLLPAFVSAAPISVDENLKTLNIGPHVEYLEDKTGALLIDNLRKKDAEAVWTPSTKDSLGFGFTKSVYWVRFTLANVADRDIEVLVQQEYPLLDTIEMWVYSDGKLTEEFKTGDTLPFYKRPMDERTFVFPLRLKANSTYGVFLRHKSESAMNIVLNLWKPADFLRSARSDERILMLYYGIMLIMIFYNLVVYFSTLRREYIYYVLFIINFLLFVMTQNGTAFEFLWPGYPWFANFCIPPILSLVIAFSLLFTSAFLDLKTNYRMGLWLVRGLLGVAIILFIASLFLSYHIGMIGTAVFSLITIIAAIGMGIHLSLKKLRSAQLYLIAWSFFLFGSAIYILKSMGALPSSLFTNWSLQAGSALMVALLSLALADRLRTMNVELKTTKISLEQRTSFLEGVMATARELSAELTRIGLDQDRIGRKFSDLSREQATMSEEMSASFEELAASANAISDSGSKQVAERERVSEIVDELRATQQTVVAMSRDAQDSISIIKKSTDETGGNMARMKETIRIIAEGGKTVRNFMSVIDEITDKINLLSLNASIEAARAGEAGRGFAVVADEVGKLATATVDNSKEISGQIGKIINDIENSMAIMQETSRSIEHIFDGIDVISGKVGIMAQEMEILSRVISTIVSQTSLLDDLTKTIGVSTEEQKQSMNESVLMVMRISEMASAMAASTSEIVEISEKMLKRAGELDSIIRENMEDKSSA